MRGGLLKLRHLPHSVILVPITAISGFEKHAELMCVSCMGADWCRVAYTSVTYCIQECLVCDIQGVTSSTHFPYSSVTLHTKERHVSHNNPGQVQPPRSHISISQQQSVLSELCVLINTD